MTRSCYFRRALSAAAVLTPPGQRNLAIVVSRCPRRMKRSFMAGEGRAGRSLEQPWRILYFRGKLEFATHTELLQISGGR